MGVSIFEQFNVPLFSFSALFGILQQPYYAWCHWHFLKFLNMPRDTKMFMTSLLLSGCRLDVNCKHHYVTVPWKSVSSVPKTLQEGKLSHFY